MWSFVVDLSQVVGAALSLVALIVALYALYKSNLDLTRELTNLHELEILRQIGSRLHPKADPLETAALIVLLPDTDFPLARAGLTHDGTEKGQRAFDVGFQQYMTETDDSNQDEKAEWRYLGRRVWGSADSRSILRREFDDAVSRRVKNPNR